MAIRAFRRFCRLVGFIFLLYALAIGARSDVGISAYIFQILHISPLVDLAMFALCGLILCFATPNPPRLVLLTLPLALVTVAVAIRVVSDPLMAPSGLVVYGGLLGLILYAAWCSAQENGLG